MWASESKSVCKQKQTNGKHSQLKCYITKRTTRCHDIDILGAFLYPETDDMVHMLLRGELAKLIVKVDPDLYCPYIKKNARGEPVMFVKCRR
eukprot:CCRYP_014104-RA/>CCRYP_014104-RA protein AED:0.45 eAED:0.47 QI:0/0/0/1/0/0/2/0/91